MIDVFSIKVSKWLQNRDIIWYDIIMINHYDIDWVIFFLLDKKWRYKMVVGRILEILEAA